MSDADNSVMQDSVMLPCDQRYRNSRYFLEDQLRCSEAANDFRSVKSLLNKASQMHWSLGQRLQTQTVPVRND